MSVLSGSEERGLGKCTRGVLVAISIPIFTSQLEKSRETTDAANIRAAYAEMMSDAITGDYTAGSYSVTLKQQQEGWQTTFDFPADLVAGTTATTKPAKNGICSLSFDADTNTPSASIALS